MASAKALLKDARQCLDTGEFPKAIELCEKVLNDEKDHYMALLLLGAAATAAKGSEYSQKALKALVRATEVKQDQEAPWQGLLRLLQKNPDLDKKLYRKVLERALTSSTDEQVSMRHRVNIAVLDGDLELLGKSLDSPTAAEDSAVVDCIARALAEKWQNQEELRGALDVLRKLSRSKLLNADFQKPIFLAYFSLLPKTEVQTEFAALSPNFPQTLAEDIAVEIFAEHEISVVKAEELLKAIAARPDCQKLPKYLLAKAKLCLQVGDSQGLDQACGVLIKLNPADGQVRTLQLEGLIRTRRYSEAETAAKAAIRSCDKKLVQVLLLFLARALHGQCRYRETLVVLERAEKLGPVDGPRAVRIECLLEVGRAEEALEQATAAGEAAWELRAKMALGHNLELDNAQLNKYGMANAVRYLLHKNRHQDALKVATAALGQAKTDAELLFLRGECYRILGDHSRALAHFHQSFLANRFHSSVGQALSRSLRAVGKHSENCAFLESLTRGGTIHDGNSWAFSELGLYHLEHGDPAAAVGPLQKVTTTKPTSLAWELLAEAYAARKSFAAAALCFSKSIDLGNEREAFIRYRLACVTRDQSRYEEAVDLFDLALQADPASPMCAHDMGQTCLALGRTRIRESLRGCARLLLSRALGVVTRPICAGHSKLIALWNLLGDVMLEAIKNSLALDAPTDVKSRVLLGLSGEDRALGSEKLASLAEKCFMRCLSLNGNLPNVWHNLAIVYSTKNQLEQSISCMKRAISLDPRSALFWNSFGVVSIKAKLSAKLAQSAFIRALVLDPELASAWANLGFVYHKSGLLREANQCFTRAQAVDPLNVECWLGQATLAATVGHFDACDLFRHSNEVKPTADGLVCHLAHLYEQQKDVRNPEVPEEMVNVVQRGLDSFDGREACEAAGYVLLKHNLTAEAVEVLCRCDSPSAKLMAAQAEALRGNWQKTATILADRKDEAARKLEAYVAWKTAGKLDDAFAVVPQLKELFQKSSEDAETRRKLLESAARGDPLSQDVWRRLAECLVELGQYGAAARITSFMKPPHRKEDLLLWVVAHAMAGRKREAFRAASTLVRNFPDQPEHWALLSWTSLATEKRGLRVLKTVDPGSDWRTFVEAVRELERVLNEGVKSPFAVGEATPGEQQARKLVEMLTESKISKAFLGQAMSLLKADPHSEAGLFLTGVWSVANNSEDLYQRCSKALPAGSPLRKLLQKQKDLREKQKAAEKNADNE